MKKSVLAIVCIALFWGCGEGQSNNATTQNLSMGQWSGWVNSLALAGYGITQGSVTEIDNAACANIVKVFGTCFGNNAAAPYIVPQVPISGYYSDPYYAPTFNAIGATGAITNMIYRLSDNDALVVVVNLPPKAAYMGYQSYVLSRVASFYSDYNGSGYQHYSPDPTRAEIFGSLGNDVNNNVVANQSGAVWSGNVIVYITTSNQNLRNTLVDNARAQGLNANFIFSEPVGSNAITGTASGADDFITLLRYALPENGSQGAVWMANLSSNVLVYRVTNNNIPIARFGAPSYTAKQSANESAYQTPLGELNTILRVWLAAAEKRPSVVNAMSVSDTVADSGQLQGLVGDMCIAKGNNCDGDNQDTDAYRMGFIGPMVDSKKTAIATGVNHTLTNAASYISLAINNMNDFTGVASVSQTNPSAVGFNSGNLTGSAEGVLKSLNLYDQASSSLKLALPYLYVALLARDCQYAKEYCVNIADQIAVPLDANISVTQRAYLKPGTTTGTNPNISSMAPSYIIFTY